MLDKVVRHVVIVGGGSAGWLTAAVLAAEHRNADGPTLQVTLLESPDVPTIGVGEGTWPTMRDTLRKIGVRESDFVRECDATFKQGSRFARWTHDEASDAYDHPFVLPTGYGETNLVAGWLPHAGQVGFAECVSFQPHLCAAGRAPKQLATPEYAAVANYAYHLDAAKLGVFLRRHCIEVLGVRHVSDHMLGVNAHDNGDIASLQTRDHGALEADLFVDCTGMRALLIGEHYGVPRVSCSEVLFNDRALAVQVPYATPDAAIACQTLSTAQRAGWIWDIGLSARRGVGHVYSSAHTSDDEAEATLRRYIEASGGPRAEQVGSPARLMIQPGYRQTAWHRNCVAIGLSSGFVEPLEASSLVLVELAATMLSEQLPATRAAMEPLARRFNDSFAYRWQRVIDFLKLHYVLSQREDSDYWRDHRRDDTLTDSLRTLLALWKQQPPSRYDLPRIEEVFPSASYQYILYGMGFRPEPRAARRDDDPARAEGYFREAAELARRMLPALPTHRALVDHIKAHGLSTL
ncbi:Tryptophan halogenase [Pseudoxanthomonas sp. GM95]|uniref:tryptophan halogenase family protein n=1 Tax=Pseudoxanthomonas sp. GM95 TaxID=1881043 RepID=UPI0008AE32B4|nr:tryptophan halogenase family protein [Pseudoxanthomonas sp. GM95]SEM17293.1 Tryptophan halogenase [Pseudoxanthomonas sp. GM95]